MAVVWNTNLIILSVLAAMYGSFAALSHAGRMRETTGIAAKTWMIAGAVTFGLAIWSMHFIGMLCLTYTLFIGITNNARETDIELTSCRQTLNQSTV